MAFTPVFAPYCRADGSGLLILLLINSFPVGSCTVLLCGWQRIVILPPVNGFQEGLRAVWLSGWHRIAYTSACQRLLRQFARRLAQWMVADCSNLHSSTAFPTVRAPYHLADSSVLLILQLVNAFHGSRAVFLRGW